MGSGKVAPAPVSDTPSNVPESPLPLSLEQAVPIIASTDTVATAIQVLCLLIEPPLSEPASVGMLGRRGVGTPSPRLTGGDRRRKAAARPARHRPRPPRFSMLGGVEKALARVGRRAVVA